MTFVGPARLCRMNDALVAQIARGEELGAVVRGAALTILVGGAAYGFAFGVWRAPEQALFAMFKLPVLLFALVLAVAGPSAMLAMLLRAPLGLRQSAVTVLVGLATTAAILGAASPAAAFVALNAPPPDPGLLGLALDDPRAAEGNHAAQTLLLFHVGVIAIAGVLGNLRLYALLRRLAGGRSDIARRVLFAWLALDLLAGSELSWLLRPFLGRPHRAPELLIHDAFDGSFFAEIADACLHAMALPGWIALGIGALLLGVLSVLSRTSLGPRVTVQLGGRGLDVRGDELRFHVAWAELGAVEPRGSGAFDDGCWLVFEVKGAPVARFHARFDDADASQSFTEALEHHRRTLGESPYRSHERPVGQDA